MTAVPLPSSPLFALLVLTIPGVWLCARALAHALTLDRTLRAALPVGLAVALWVVSVHLASLAAGSFQIGLPVGAITVAAAGVALTLARRRPDREVAAGRAPSPWMWITAALAALVLAPAAFNYYFHDELLIGGHMATAAQIHWGVYPPRQMQFPELPFRYHYGFDLLSASISALLRVGVDRGIDIATLLLWASSWILLWALGDRLLGRRFAWLTPVTTLLASGMAVSCSRPPGSSLLPGMISECPVGRLSVNGPVITYFFQHPWGLGIPVTAALILVFTERAPRRAGVRFALLAFLFAALSFSELVLFVTVVPSMIVAELRYEDRLEIRRAPAILGAALLALGAAKLMGGFFTAAQGRESMKFILHAGFAETLKDTLRWNAMTLGVMWLTGLAGLIVLRRGRLLFGLLGAGALVVVNAVRFTATADIMKFATVAQLSFGLLGSAFIAALLPAAPRAAAPFRRALAAVALASVTWVGFLYPIFFFLDLGDIPGSFKLKPETLSPADVIVIGYLREHARRGELVYRASGPGTGYAQWAGIPQPWLDWTSKAWGIPAPRLAKREQLLKNKPAGMEEWVSQGFRWMVLDESKSDEKALTEAAQLWIHRGKAKLATRAASLRVVELTP